VTSADHTRHTLTLARIALILGLNALAAFGAQSGAARTLPRPLPPPPVCCPDPAQPATIR